MKKIFIISFLTFFSISAIAETNLRCEFNRSCSDKSCTDYTFKNFTNNSPVNISYHEGFFSNKLTYNSSEVQGNIWFEEKTIIFFSHNDEERLTFHHKIDKQNLIYFNTVLENKVTDFIEGMPIFNGMPDFRIRHVYLCTKID